MSAALPGLARNRYRTSVKQLQERSLRSCGAFDAAKLQILLLAEDGLFADQQVLQPKARSFAHRSQLRRPETDIAPCQ